MSGENYSQERRDMVGSINKGKKLSDETREKVRQARLATIARGPLVYTEEAMANMKLKSKAVSIFNPDGTLCGIFDSVTLAAAAYECDVKTIRRGTKRPTPEFTSWKLKRKFLAYWGRHDVMPGSV